MYPISSWEMMHPPVVLNNMPYDVMALLYDYQNGAMHECNYSKRSYTVVYDTSIIYSVM
jgi:hypothetical protein